MATLEKAEALLEELRGASYDAAVKELDEVRAYAAENVRTLLPCPITARAGHGNAQSTRCCAAGSASCAGAASSEPQSTLIILPEVGGALGCSHAWCQDVCMCGIWAQPVWTTGSGKYCARTVACVERTLFTGMVVY